MKSFQGIFSGFFATILSGIIVLGALSLTVTEGMVFAPPTAIVTEIPPETPVPTFPGQTSLPPTSSPTSTKIISRMITATRMMSTACAIPNGWIAYTVLAGDTLEALASSRGVNTELIIRGNCLLSTNLLPQTTLFLPPLPATVTATHMPFTSTPQPCGPPVGWISYVVRTYDTLFGISLAYGVSVPELQAANCMGSSTLIRVGQTIWVPNVPTRTPYPTVTPSPTTTTRPTETPTATHTEISPTWTWTPEPPTATPTSTETATWTPTVTDTETATPTMNSSKPTATDSARNVHSAYKKNLR